MSDRDRKPPFRRGGGKPFDKSRDKGRSGGRRQPWQDRGAGLGLEGPAILYGWHTVSMALQNPERRIRKLLLTENAAKRLADENIVSRVTPEIVRPGEIDRLLTPDAVHQGLLAEADALPSPDIEDLAQEGMVLVLDQITDPHNVGAILRSAAAFAVKAIVTTARHSPEATGVLAKAASGALELVPLVTVQNLARALTALNERGFMTVGLDSEGEADISAGAGARRRRQGPAAIDAGDLQPCGAARHARRDQEPQRFERRGAGALCRRDAAWADRLKNVTRAAAITVNRILSDPALAFLEGRLFA
jgi:23S rRNA (guanosine2251-2'-O)-methyltransferase